MNVVGFILCVCVFFLFLRTFSCSTVDGKMLSDGVHSAVFALHSAHVSHGRLQTILMSILLAGTIFARAVGLWLADDTSNLWENVSKLRAGNRAWIARLTWRWVDENYWGSAGPKNSEMKYERHEVRGITVMHLYCAHTNIGFVFESYRPKRRIVAIETILVLKLNNKIKINFLIIFFHICRFKYPKYKSTNANRTWFRLSANMTGYHLVGFGVVNSWKSSKKYYQNSYTWCVRVNRVTHRYIACIYCACIVCSAYIYSNRVRWKN